MSGSNNAVKYLMTYRWAVVIGFIAGMVIWQLNIYRPPSLVQVIGGYSGFGQVMPLNWSLTQDQDGVNTIAVTFLNNASLAVRLDGSDAKMVEPGTGYCNSGTPDRVEVVWPNAAQELTYENCLIDNPQIGDRYIVNVTLQYTNISTGLRYKTNGIIWGAIGRKYYEEVPII
jgi:hypothetical protein